jgi:hypothetical protein
MRPQRCGVEATMKRLVFAVLLGGVALAVGGASGLAAVWLAGGTALAAGFGWMIGGLPGGAGADGSSGADDGGDSGGDGGGGGGA